MEVQRFDSNGRFCRVVTCQGIVYFSGHVAKGEGIAAQARALLKRMDELFDQYGTSKEDLLSVTLYFANISMIDEFNLVWDEWVSQENAPTRCTFGCQLQGDFLVEMSVIATKKQ